MLLDMCRNTQEHGMEVLLLQEISVFFYQAERYLVQAEVVAVLLKNIMQHFNTSILLILLQRQKAEIFIIIVGFFAARIQIEDISCMFMMEQQWTWVAGLEVDAFSRPSAFIKFAFI